MQNTATKLLLFAMVLFWTAQPSCFRGVTAAETAAISALESLETIDSGESISVVDAGFGWIALADFLSPFSRPVQEATNFNIKLAVGGVWTLRGPPAI